MVAFSDFDDAEAWDDVTRGNDDWDAVFMKAEAQEKALKSSSGQSISATTYVHHVANCVKWGAGTVDID